MAEEEENLRPNTGVVKAFNDQKGFGFITPDHGSEDLYFHHSSILSNNGSCRLAVGTIVEFSLYFGGDGLTKAVDVIVPNVRGGGGGRVGGGYWYSCGGEGGHRSGDFGYGGVVKTCFNCGERGHMAMNCNNGGGSNSGGRGE